LLCAWNIFVYQLMDNLDGKQARLTGTSSPLGELFDHGCDSLFLVLVSVGLSTALNLENWECMHMFSAGVLVFYASHWEEYHTNHLIMGKYANPTEAQCGMMVFLIISAVAGPTFWSNALFSVNGFDVSLKTFLILATILACIGTLGENGLKTYLWAQENQRTLFEAVAPILPMFVHVSLMYLWIWNSPSNVLQHNALLVVVFLGLVFSYLCDQLVICRVTKMKFTVANPILVFPFILAANAVLFSVGQSAIPDSILLPLLLSVLGVIYVYFLVSVVLQLKHHLDIDVFTIPLKSSK